MKVLLPTSVHEACRMLAEQSDLVPMAGATDLLVHWPGRQDAHEKSYLDLSALSDLRTTKWTDDTLTLGALTTYWDTALDERVGREFPVLIQAARQVGAIQIQSRGTWAGNIMNASPAADGVPALMSYDASVTLTSATGSRSVALSEFYLGYRKTVRNPDELVTEVTLPRRAYDFGQFHKVGPRRAQAITKVGVAMTHQAGVAADGWRIVANSVAPTVRRCPHLEYQLDAGPLVRSPDDFLQSVNADVSPIDDIRSTADYRRTVLCRLLYHSLKGACPMVV